MESAETTQPATTTAPIASPADDPGGPIDAATGKPAAPDLKIRKLSRYLKTEMTAADRDEATRRMLDLYDERDAVELRKKAAVSHAKAELERIAEDVGKLRRDLRNNGTWSDVECEERSDFRTCTVEVVRCDTAEVLSSRAMTVEERQTLLFDEVPAVAADGHPPADDPGWLETRKPDEGASPDVKSDDEGSEDDGDGPELVVHEGGKAQSKRSTRRRKGSDVEAAE